MMIVLIQTGKKGKEILSERMMNLILDAGPRSQSQTHLPSMIWVSTRYMRRKTWNWRFNVRNKLDNKNRKRISEKRRESKRKRQRYWYKGMINCYQTWLLITQEFPVLHATLIPKIIIYSRVSNFMSVLSTQTILDAQWSCNFIMLRSNQLSPNLKTQVSSRAYIKGHELNSWKQQK